MTGPGPAAMRPPSPPKVDPEKLELRARPRPAVRFRKGLVMGVAATATALIAAIGWVALDPPDFRLRPPEQGSLTARQPADALEGVPASYDQVPMLGPPLPGDLGRPILRHRSGLVEGQQEKGEADRLGGGQERVEAVRPASLMVELARPAASVEARNVNAPGGAPGALRLHSGTIISASLITGINSDLPGIVLAQVTEPVHDSATGRHVLIPQGARLIGEYDSRVDFGQRRAMLTWDRIILPDGRSIALDKLPASDRAGYSGLAGKVDFHGWRLLKGVALSTALGIGTELSLGDGEDAVLRALSGSAELASARAGDEITRRNLDVKPTITVRPGWPLRLILNQDLSIEPWRG